MASVRILVVSGSWREVVWGVVEELGEVGGEVTVRDRDINVLRCPLASWRMVRKSSLKRLTQEEEIRTSSKYLCHPPLYGLPCSISD